MTPGLFAHRPESVITKAIALLLSDEKNRAGQRGCRQLIDGAAAVDWLELYGQK
ncbi:hypothetical protein SynBIOSU31_02630 [Synechococcus sp. BIOS-U3-1]|nr:hypothetical protein SynBIOSU31_02630 [Synechococcus sp. BIOS-U3-1]|tara:strand:- start:1864 stop:2025 length:162 start_codon:yes stop_codon:yes gene_type:complete